MTHIRHRFSIYCSSAFLSTDMESFIITVRTVLSVLVFLWVGGTTAYSEDISILTEEDKTQLSELADAYSTTLKETKKELENIQTKYMWAVETFGNRHYPNILEKINTLDKNGFRKYLKGAIDFLGSANDQFDSMMSVKDDYDKTKAFFDRYRPDKNNPMRSLEQIGNILEDLNTVIEKVDVSGGVATKPIRETIAFFVKATKAYHGALQRIETRLQKRTGNGIGEGIPGTSEKDLEFIRKFSGVTVWRFNKIKYNKPGTDQEDAEFWEDNGGRAFVWKDGKWSEIRCGVHGLETVFNSLYLVYGSRPDIHTLLAGCNVDSNTLDTARKIAINSFNILNADRDCREDILKALNITLKPISRKVFIAKFIFDSNYTQIINEAVRHIENTVFIEGKVTALGNSGSGLSDIAITVRTSAGEVTTVSEAGGWFSMTLNMPFEKAYSSANVYIKADGYTEYLQAWPLQGQCNQWYTITLEKDGVQVPSLLGLTSSKGIDILEKLNLVPEGIYAGKPPIPEQADRIIWQSPDSNQSVAEGTRVSFRAYGSLPSQPDDSDNTLPGENISPPVPGNPQPEVEISDNDTPNQELYAGYDGGLFISGPTSMITGQTALFSASDGTGKVYPASGTYTWNSTLEDALVLGRSGNSVRGSAHKAGKAMVLLKFDVGQAWLDVTIKAKVPDVTRMSPEKAAGLISRLNLNPSITGPEGDSNPDMRVVLSQTPEAGSILEEGGMVTLNTGPGEPMEGDDADLFSMEGGETVDTLEEEPDNTGSLFSMEGGGTVDDFNQETHSGGSQISLLGETLNGGEQQGEITTNIQKPAKQTPDNGEITLRLLEYWSPIDSRRRTTVPWSSYYSFWSLQVSLDNISPEKIISQGLYLKVRINDQVFYMYRYNSSYKDKYFEEHLPYKNTGMNTIEISCPALPGVTPIRVEKTIQRKRDSVYQQWVNDTSPESIRRLNQLKREYENACKTPDKINNMYYTSEKYSDLLHKISMSLCHLENFKDAAVVNDMEFDLIRQRINIAASREHTYGITSSVERYCWSLFQRANIALMAYGDASGYLKYAGELLKTAETYGQIISKGHMSYWTMNIAENLLSTGHTKTEAEPFFNFGFKNLSHEDQTRFKKGYEFRPNCLSVFVEGIPASGRR